MQKNLFHLWGILIAVVIASSTNATASSVAPFGFSRGMTKEQVIAKIGSQNVISEEHSPKGIDALVVKTSPVPNINFSTYVLIFVDGHGLLKLEANGLPTQTRSGEEIRVDLFNIKEHLSLEYGDPDTVNDTDSVFLPIPNPNDRASYNGKEAYHDLHPTDPDPDFCNELLAHRRTLSTLWFPKNSANLVTSVNLSAVGVDAQTAKMVLGYEFVGWTEFIHSLRK